MDTATPQQPEFTEQEQQLLQFYNDSHKLPNKKFIFIVAGEKGELLAGMDENGTMCFGETYQPDTAAQEFWNSVARNAVFVDRLAALHNEIDRLKIECYDLKRTNMELRATIDNR